MRSSWSSTAIRPWAMMMTRPQTASTSDMMWVESRIVCRSPSSRIRSRTSRIWIGSSPEVGSSRIRMSGSWTIASASPTRWRKPRERWPRTRRSTSASRHRGDHLADRPPASRPGHVLELGPVAQVLRDAHLVVERDVLRQVADLPADLERLVEDVVPGEARPAAGGGEEGREDPHRRGLARPRWDRAARRSRPGRPRRRSARWP